MFDAATQEQIAIWRQKSRDNTMTVAEMREAIQILRQGRKAASTTSDKAKTKKAAAKVAVNSDDLLGELDEL